VTVEAIGVDLGGTKMLVGAVDADRNVAYRSTAPSMGLSQEDLIHTLERELRTAMDARPEAGSVGLGIPCTIDRRRGVAVMAVNLQLADVPIRDLMQERLGVPVAIDNDANAAVLAEHRFGAARGATNVVMLTIGTGIGGGLVIEGELYRGSAGAGAELGHVVIEADGPPCQGNCPNHGCVEVMASGTAIAREGLVAAEKAPDSALGRALAAGLHGERDELMASTAAYSGLRWGELTALTIGQVDQAGRVITVDRQVIEVAGHLYTEAPKCRKYRKTIYPRRTPDGYPLAGKLAARIEQAAAEHQAGTNPLGLVFPSPTGKHWRSSNFNRNVLKRAYLAVGWRDAAGNGKWTWHSLRHVFCTTALFTWKLDATDVSRMAGTRITASPSTCTSGRSVVPATDGSPGTP